MSFANAGKSLRLAKLGSRLGVVYCSDVLGAPTRALRCVNLPGQVNLGRYLARPKINGKLNDESEGQSKQLGVHIEKIIKVKIT